MRKAIIIITALFAIATTAMAQEIVEGVSVKNLVLERNGDYMVINMDIDLTNLDVSSNRAILLTPRITNGNNSIDLTSIGVYGRKRYYFYVRNGESMLTGPEEATFKAKDKPNTVPFHNIIQYQEWMNGANLALYRAEFGCCNELLAEQLGMLKQHTEPVEFFPTLVYMQPKAEMEKSRSLEGSAYIDFPVDKTRIYPEYRRNTVELKKIQATIDSVRNDKDITITSVWLKGYASPESPYSHNTELAIGRTAALKKYIQRLYQFEPGIISTDYEPENWEGLRKYVEGSNILHREQILELIDRDMNPDHKEWTIKQRYPQQYRFLLDYCYPALRRTDYRIAYNIRSYSDIEEIKRILHTQPQKLSLNEFYLVTQHLQPGSDEFTEAFETAVRMYPEDEVANLNAANAAMRRNDMERAERYLAKAGKSPEAIYARGAYAFLTKDYESARALFQVALGYGVQQAAETLRQMPTQMKK